MRVATRGARVAVVVMQSAKLLPPASLQEVREVDREALGPLPVHAVARLRVDQEPGIGDVRVQIEPVWADFTPSCCYTG